MTCDDRPCQVPAAPQADLHRGREEAAGVGVQGADEEQARGDAAAVVRRRRARARGRPALPALPARLQAQPQSQSSPTPQISR